MTPIPPIPEDLQALYEKAKWHNAEITYTSKHKPHPYDNPTTLVTLIERIAKLTAEVETLQIANGQLAVKVVDLEAENTRLKAPVSDEEREHYFLSYDDREVSDVLSVSQMIASRATRTPPQEGQ